MRRVAGLITVCFCTGVFIAGLLLAGFWVFLLLNDMVLVYERNWTRRLYNSQNRYYEAHENYSHSFRLGDGQVFIRRTYAGAGDLERLRQQKDFLSWGEEFTIEGAQSKRVFEGFLDFGYTARFERPRSFVFSEEAEHHIHFPIWLGVAILLLPGMVPMAALNRRWRRRRLRKAGRCLACGYDLRGQPNDAALCPECGEVREPLEFHQLHQ